jgi:iron complex transport system substrate-binding protein
MLMFFLAACGQVPAGGSPVNIGSTPTAQPAPTHSPVAPLTLTDGLGRPLTLQGPAQRIVSLTPATTEMLFAVGAGKQLAGRDMFSDYPEAARSVQDIGGSMGEYNTEAIVALKPDLVLAGGINPPELVASLQQLGLPVYFVANPNTLEELYDRLDTIGLLTGHEAEASALVGSLMDRVAAVDARIATTTERPMVYYELDASTPTAPYTAGPGTFVDQLIARAGGTNFGAQLADQWAKISLEQLVVANPAMIILGDSAYGETPEKVAARPGWNTLDAVKDKRIFPFDDNLVSRPGPRLVDGLEALAKIIHPEAFK